MRKPNWRNWLKSRELCVRWNKLYLKKSILRRRSLKPEEYLKKALHNLDFANWIYEKHKTEIKELFGKERFFDMLFIMLLLH